MADLCRNGLHPMSGDNILYRAARGIRECRACNRNRAREYQRRVRAAYIREREAQP